MGVTRSARYGPSLVGRPSDHITHQQLTALEFEMGRRAVVAGVVQFALFIFFYCVTPFSTGRPAGTNAAFFVLACTVVLRAVVAWLQRRAVGDRQRIARCRLLFRAVIMLGATTWGLLAVPTVLQYGLTPPSSVLLVFVMGIAMLSLQNFGLDLALVRAFVIVIVGPGTLALLFHPSEPAAFVMGSGYLMYGGFLLFLSTRSHAVLWEALAGRTIIQGQRDQLTAVLDALPGFVVWMDAFGTIMGLNEKLAAEYAVPMKELLGRRLDEITADEEFLEKVRAFRAGPSTEELFEAQHTARAGGAPRWMLLALKKYGEGNRELLIIGLDIGDRKRAESERDQARASAYQASRLAELGVMAAGIGHEINNPLQALSYGLGILRLRLESPALSREQLSEDGLRIVKRATATIQRIAAIVQGLRSFSHEDASGEFGAVDLCEVMHEIQELGSATMPSAGLELKVECPAEPLIVRGRRAQIGQVMVNLINNARDAVEGSTELAEKWVRVVARDLGESVELSVSDSGPGIPAELREQLMVPFFTTKGVGRGTGLGLSISKAIVDHHHGRLYLDTAAAHTRFVVVLPKDPERAAA